MKLLVGCPVRDRGWILHEWFEAVEKACEEIDIEPEYVFVAGASLDNTNSIIKNKALYRKIHVLNISDPGLPPDVHRSWVPERLQFMVDVRNDLLRTVRTIEPDLFFSLDSDILIHPLEIRNLIESAETFDAVGGRAYMSFPDSRTTSWGTWIEPDPRMKRGPDCAGVVQAGIIMAIKMMNPTAYNVDYEFHHYGEDLGWSWACRQKHLALGFDGRVINKHCLHPWMINKVDPRVGF